MIGFFALLAISSAEPPLTDRWTIDGRIWTDQLFIFDQNGMDSVSVVEVYQNNDKSNPGQLEKVIFGKDTAAIEAECQNRYCVRRTLRGGETIVERVIAGSNNKRSVTESQKTGATWISGLGLDTRVERGSHELKIKGNFSASLLNERTLYGHERWRPSFTEAYYQYRDEKSKRPYFVRLGRQNPTAGVLVDGASATLLFGKEGYRDSKSIGVFAGLAPHPVTKRPNHERSTFGLQSTYIPEFSAKSDSKLKVDSSLVGELYKNKFNRFYLYNRTHFTPIRELSLIGMLTLDLPAAGDDGSVGVNYTTLQSLWRPDTRWFLSFGFTAFKIDRFLREESVRWLTDDQSQQQDRLGDTLDRSYRYRGDVRASFKAFWFLQAYLKLRYERRSFDSNKTRLNQAPTTSALASPNLSLLNKKNAYRIQPGLRIFPIADLETETSFAYNQRFQSRAYELFQSANWEPRPRWNLDAYGQAVWSRRSIANSVASTPSVSSKATDYYAGLGISYKLLADLVGQIRYDFSCEDDASLEESILSHSAWLRFHYQF
jgi:hypothetical protein